jgi:hypothetical protein
MILQQGGQLLHEQFVGGILYCYQWQLECHPHKQTTWWGICREEVKHSFHGMAESGRGVG